MEKKRYEIVIFISFCLVILITFLVNYYNNQVNEVGKIVFPSGESDYAFFNGMKIKDSKDFKIDTNVDLELAPGQEFNGLMALKSHKPYDREFSIISNPFISSSADLKTPVPNLIFDNVKFILPGDGIKFVDYKIIVPKDIKPDTYKATMKAKVTDGSAQKVNYEGVNMEIALGSEIRVLVSESAANIQYEKRSDIIYDYAKIRLVIAIRWIAGVALLFLTCYFVLKGF